MLTVIQGMHGQVVGDVMKSLVRFCRDNGLTMVLVAAFALCLAGMLGSGWLEENSDLALHGQRPLPLMDYVFSASFQSALFENWESEFLQMAAYVIMTAMLFQRGSAESKDSDRPGPEDADPAEASDDPSAPWPVRAGGIWSALYSYSLGLALLALFITSFILHWVQSAAAFNEDTVMHGGVPHDLVTYLAEPRFWFESFQNWQSEFLSTAVLVVLSIALRHRGSPESKAVADPHAKTGH